MSTPQGADVQALVAERGGVPITVNNGNGTTVQMATGIGLIIAVTAANLSITAAARAILRDGTDTTGSPLAYLAMPAAAGISPGIDGPGIYFGTGLYAQLAAGSAQVSVTYIPLTLPLK